MEDKIIYVGSKVFHLAVLVRKFIRLYESRHWLNLSYFLLLLNLSYILHSKLAALAFTSRKIFNIKRHTLDWNTTFHEPQPCSLSFNLTFLISLDIKRTIAKITGLKAQISCTTYPWCFDSEYPIVLTLCPIDNIGFILWQTSRVVFGFLMCRLFSLFLLADRVSHFARWVVSHKMFKP